MHLNAFAGILEETGQGNIYSAIGVESEDLLRECATLDESPGELAQWFAFKGLDIHDGFQRERF